MAFQIHGRVVLRGTIAGGEIWTTSVAARVPGASPSQADLQTLATAALSAMTAWFGAGTGGGSYFSTAVTLERADAYFIRPDGQAEGQAEAVATTPPVGIGAPLMPPQASVVLSLRTGLPGRARRGRMYIPLLALPLGSDARMTPAVQTALGNRAAAFLGAINAAVAGGGTWRVIVASGVGAGQNTIVNSVVIGRVVDTQRRRRNGLPEGNVAFPVTG